MTFLFGHPQTTQSLRGVLLSHSFCWTSKTSYFFTIPPLPSNYPKNSSWKTWPKNILILMYIYIYVHTIMCVRHGETDPPPKSSNQISRISWGVQRLSGSHPNRRKKFPEFPEFTNEWLAGTSTESFNRKYPWLIQIMEFLPAIVISLVFEWWLKFWMDSLRLNKKQTVLLKWWFNSINFLSDFITSSNFVAFRHECFFSILKLPVSESSEIGE